MIRVSNVRSSIYDYFHSTKACFNYLTSRDAEYAAYYTSMFLIQDTADSLIAHRGRDFSKDSMQAYIEFWGVIAAGEENGYYEPAVMHRIDALERFAESYTLERDGDAISPRDCCDE